MACTCSVLLASVLLNSCLCLRVCSSSGSVPWSSFGVGKRMAFISPMSIIPESTAKCCNFKGNRENVNWMSNFILSIKLCTKSAWKLNDTTSCSM
uniref:Np21 n=1 Tax=Stichopus japonicus TaxID=307972 RepID=A0A2U8RLL9_STIJA|nr:np21 precursor [Apostichopus japonicus]